MEGGCFEEYLHNASEQYHKVVRDKQALQQECDRLKETISASKNEHQKLQEQKAATELRLKKFEDECSNYKKGAGQKDDKITELCASEKDLWQKLDSASSEIAGLQNSNACLTTDIGARGKELADLRTQSTSQRKELDALARERDSANAARQASHEEVTTLRAAVAANQREIQTYRRTNDCQKKALDIHENMLAEAKASETAVKQTLKTTALESGRLKTDLDARTKNLSAVQAEKEVLTSQLQDVHGKYEKCKIAFKAARAARDTAKDLHEGTQKTVQALRLQHQKLSEELAVAQTRAQEVSLQLEARQIETAALHDRVQSLIQERDAALSSQLCSQKAVQRKALTTLKLDRTKEREHEERGIEDIYSPTTHDSECLENESEDGRKLEVKLNRIVFPAFEHLVDSECNEHWPACGVLFAKGREPDLGQGLRQPPISNHERHIATEVLLPHWRLSLVDLSTLGDANIQGSDTCGNRKLLNHGDIEITQVADGASIHHEHCPRRPSKNITAEPGADQVTSEDCTASQTSINPIPFRSSSPGHDSGIATPPGSRGHSTDEGGSRKRKRQRSPELDFHYKAVCQRCLYGQRKCSSNGECRGCKEDGKQCRYFSCRDGARCENVMCNKLHPRQWLGNAKGDWVVD